MAIIKNEVQDNTPTQEYENTKPIFINNSDGDLIGFLNLSSHITESAYEAVVAWLNKNSAKLEVEFKKNSKRNFIQLNVGNKVMGFMNEFKEFKVLKEAVNNEWDIEFNLAQDDVTEDNVDEFLNSL